MNENVLDDFSVEKLQTIRRRKLLPIVIKIFLWIFIVMGSLAIPGFIVGLLGVHFELALYGFETNEPQSSIGILLFSLFVFKAFVGFSLWLEWDWAILAGIVDAVVGIVVCIYSMYVNQPEGHSFTFRLELLVLIPYLVWLVRVRKKWQEAGV
jgi:hypothetical protein